MRLLSALRGRFFSPELCRVAKTTDIAVTIECLARSPVVVVGADLGRSVQFDAKESEIIAIAEAATQKKSFDGEIHKYAIDDHTYLPVFTDVATAEAALLVKTWCEWRWTVEELHKAIRVPSTWAGLRS